MFLHDLCFFLFFSFSLRNVILSYTLIFATIFIYHFKWQTNPTFGEDRYNFYHCLLETRQQVFWYGKKHRELKDWNKILVYWIEKDFNFRIYCSRNPFLFPICISYIFVCLFSFSRQIPKVIQVEKIRQKYYFKFKRKKINDSL